MPGTFLEADLDDAYDDEALAVTGTVNGTEVTGFYDREYVRGLGMVSGAAPAFRIRAADEASMPVGGTFVLSGSSFVIRDHEPIDDGDELAVPLEVV